MIRVLYFSPQLLTRHSEAEILSFTDHEVYFFSLPGTKEIEPVFRFPLDEFPENLTWASPKLTLPTGGLRQHSSLHPRML